MSLFLLPRRPSHLNQPGKKIARWLITSGLFAIIGIERYVAGVVGAGATAAKAAASLPSEVLAVVRLLAMVVRLAVAASMVAWSLLAVNSLFRLLMSVTASLITVVMLAIAVVRVPTAAPIAVICALSAVKSRMALSETASMWQSLSFGPNYKAAYCVAACPAGEDVILPFLRNKPAFVKEVVRPLQEKVEPIYVIKGSDAEGHVKKRFPGKKPKLVRSGLRPSSAASFIAALPLLFQPGQAKEMNVRYRFIFSGADTTRADVFICEGKLHINPDGAVSPDVTIRADATTWLRFLSEEISIVWALLTLRIRISGKIWLMKDFQKCFPT